MDATQSNHPVSDVMIFIFSGICFMLSKIHADEFRAWTWWAIGMAVFVFALVRDWKKVKAQIKDWTKK